MLLAKDFEDFVQLLNKHEVEYMVVGGYALAFHGKPRFTGDLDIWINISEKNAFKLLEVLDEFGLGSFSFHKDDFLQPGYVTQIGYPPLRIDILNTIDGVHFNDAYSNRQKVMEGDWEITYIGLHDLLRNKEASGRERDMEDVREIKKLLLKQHRRQGKQA